MRRGRRRVGFHRDPGGSSTPGGGGGGRDEGGKGMGIIVSVIARVIARGSIGNRTTMVFIGVLLFATEGDGLEGDAEGGHAGGGEGDADTDDEVGEVGFLGIWGEVTRDLRRGGRRARESLREPGLETKRLVEMGDHSFELVERRLPSYGDDDASSCRFLGSFDAQVRVVMGETKDRQL
ncbi:hypothetical protein BC829DRAFT_434673 [Chytridium lagenaria]|nr:hypothetical protein BC829DRAFT_434673 [Chytridium lagenaria]